MGSNKNDRYVSFLKNRLWEKRFSKNNSKSKDILFISFSNECRVLFITAGLEITGGQGSVTGGKKQGDPKSKFGG